MEIALGANNPHLFAYGLAKSVYDVMHYGKHIYLSRYNLAMETDEARWAAWMLEAQKGNEQQYQRLLTELSHAITNYLRSRFGGYDFIDDCVQESLIAIHQARHTYDARRPFRPWLFTIVRHKAIDTLRKQRSQQETRDSYQTETLLQQTDPAHSGLESEFYDNMGEMLAELPEHYREVLLLTKVQGYSIAETAEQLNTTVAAVKVRVHRAIQKLRTSLESEEHG